MNKPKAYSTVGMTRADRKRALAEYRAALNRRVVQARARRRGTGATRRSSNNDRFRRPFSCIQKYFQCSG